MRWTARLTALLLWLAATGGAATVGQAAALYEHEVPVTEQSDASLERAAREALEAVLVRVSGDRDAARAPALEDALARAETLMEQYRYGRNDGSGRGASSARDVESGEEEDAPWLLHVSFSESVIHGLLREAGLPLWPANRPRVMTWLALDDEEGRHFANPDDDPVWREAWNRAAERRGVPLQFPLLDLVDRAALPVESVWDLRADAVWEASERYNPDALLLCRAAALSGGRWVGNCRFSVQGESLRLEVNADNAGDYTARVIDRLADELAERYAIASVGEGGGLVLMQLSGVEAFADYSSAMQLLEELAAVDAVSTVGAEGDRLLLALTLGTDVERLRDALGLERRLRTAGTVSVPYAGQPTGALHYRWLSPEKRR